ncbi:BQ5605_C026g10184 [Microbotryum silenes-dioicae]|uniref:BQ5605_C026g10184 protein n=1 Tax=Microbotryum silenes-dioicae TaxID=796604 RepID=A0A2X0MQY1_9BASI|nr:BQ5605_C026g10184 [Microbotryum silenes-dioicae]
MALVWAWGRVPSRHGPAKKPAGQRKQGEANRGGKPGRRAGKQKFMEFRVSNKRCCERE